MITAITATFHVDTLDNPRRELTMIMGPGQDILADAPKIISVALWADNRHANRVKIISLQLSDVNV